LLTARSRELTELLAPGSDRPFEEATARSLMCCRRLGKVNPRWPDPQAGGKAEKSGPQHDDFDSQLRPISAKLAKDLNDERRLGRRR
jgi:hypothetical protein